MIWIISTLVLVGIAVGMFFLGKAALRLIIQAEEHRKNEDFFAVYRYSDEEWEHLFQSEFLDDERANGWFGPYASVISIGQYDPVDPAKTIHFSDRAIYLTGGGKRKSFAVNRLNLSGHGIHITSVRPLYLTPLNRLEVKIHIDFLGDDAWVDIDLDYVVPVPQAAAADIDKIMDRYGKVILGT